MLFDQGAKLNWVVLSAIHTSLRAIAANTRNKILLYRAIISKRAVSRDQDGQQYGNVHDPFINVGGVNCSLLLVTTRISNRRAAQF